LLQSKNSAAIVAGNNFIRLFSQWNIVISESGPGEHLVGAAVSQLVSNLTSQGLTLARAREIVLYQLDQGATNPNTRAPELDHAVPAGTQLYGPQGLQRIIAQDTALLISRGLSTIKAQQTVLSYVLQRAPLHWLFRLGIGHELPQPSPQPGPGPGPQPGPGPGGNQFSQCCDEIQTSLAAIATAIGAGAAPSTINVELQQIAVNLGNIGNAVAAAAINEPQDTAIIQFIAAELTRLADTLQQCICEMLTQLVQDVEQIADRDGWSVAELQALDQLGALPAPLAQEWGV